MDTRTIRAPASFALASATVAVLLLVPGTAAHTTTVEIADSDLNTAVGVTDVARRGDVVVGTIVNHGGDVVRDVRLLIDLPFLWANEVKPGEDSPSRSTIMTVAGPLEPHDRLAFEFTPNPPLADRIDGHYADPQVHVLGYQSIATR